MSSSFYVVLASDASIDQYPENTPSSFKMQLPSQMHLREDWEVAMTHIIYPHTWENIHSNQVSYLLRYNGEKEWTLPIYLPRDTCRTVEDLISGMVTGLESAFQTFISRVERGSNVLEAKNVSTFTKKSLLIVNCTYPQDFK